MLLMGLAVIVLWLAFVYTKNQNVNTTEKFLKHG